MKGPKQASVMEYKTVGAVIVVKNNCWLKLDTLHDGCARKSFLEAPLSERVLNIQWSGTGTGGVDCRGSGVIKQGEVRDRFFMRSLVLRDGDECFFIIAVSDIVLSIKENLTEGRGSQADGGSLSE
jgi:hypothetical protein